MNKTIVTRFAVVLCAIGIAGQVLAATHTNQEKSASEKLPSAGPFHAKLVSIDKVAKTITVGKRTFLITPETKFNKAGKPATIDDGVIGEQVSGYVKPNNQGKLVATKVNFGPKPEDAGAATKGKPGKNKQR